MKRIFSLFFLLFSLNLSSQDLSGKVIEILDDMEVPITGANIYLIDNSQGTISDENGNFGWNFQSIVKGRVPVLKLSGFDSI